MGVWAAQPGGRRDRDRRTRTWRELPARRSPTSDRATSSARRTASATTSSTTSSAGRRAWPPPARALADRGIAADPRLRAQPRRPRPPVDRRAPRAASSAGTGDDLARDPRVVRRGRRPGAGLRPRPVLPGLARRGAAQRLLAARCAPRSVDTLRDIADQCDGVRCDMAMLVLNDVFARTWGDRVGRARPRPSTGRRSSARCAPTHPDFRLPRRGLLGPRVGSCSSRASTSATTSGSTTGWSHGERRAGAPPPPRRPRLPGPASSASSRTTTSRGPRRRSPPAPDEPRPSWRRSPRPGARLVHDGQLEGRRVHLPVFLGRVPDEPPDPELRAFYEPFSARCGDPTLPTGRVAALRTIGLARQRQLAETSWPGAGTARRSAGSSS